MIGGWLTRVAVPDLQAAQPREIESPLPGGIADAVRFFFSAVPQWIQVVGAVLGLVLGVAGLYYAWQKRHEVKDWLLTRSATLQAIMGLAVVVAVLGAGWFGQRAWDYTQHSNAFCTACHVMAEPFQEFRQSVHTGLQCHDCHQQSVFASMRQVYLWVADRPGEIGEHAPVPNDVCTNCHVEGDPRQWRQVERTAGHRVHFASDSLPDLQCVECHGASVHRFTPSKATCGQSGCHGDVEMRLGGMSDLTVHCVACHDFTRPTSGRMVAGGADDSLAMRDRRDTLTAGLLEPERRQCMSCHAMRSRLVDFPVDDPHDAECSACHNPHEQEESARAVASCTTGGCHTPLDTTANRHHRIEADVVAECTQCHTAHSFDVRGQSCLNCHQEIFRTSALGSEGSGRGSPGAPGIRLHRGGIAPPAFRKGEAGAVGGGPADPSLREPGARRPLEGRRARGGSAEREARPASPRSVRALPQDTTPFTHDDHRDLDCLTCHQTEAAAEPLPETAEWCASCHHEASSARSCTSCHARAAVRRWSADVTRTMRFSVGEPRSRTLPFSHQPHDTIACTTCHTGRPLLSAEGVACAECHEEHHKTESPCQECHARAPTDAHPVEVHLSCTGSGCHDSSRMPARAVSSRGRNVCLACHQEQADHRPGQQCVYCHVLPDEHGTAGPGGDADGVRRGSSGGKGSR